MGIASRAEGCRRGQREVGSDFRGTILAIECRVGRADEQADGSISEADRGCGDTEPSLPGSAAAVEVVGRCRRDAGAVRYPGEA